MNVVFLSDHGSQGGAAVAAKGIIRSIMQGNYADFFHHVVFFEDYATSIQWEFIELAGQGALHPLWYEETDVKRQIYRLPRKLLPGIFPRPHTAEFAARRLRAKLAELRPDVINVHNLHAAAPWGWGPHLVEVCLEFAPVVWTLHDMWSFTGRCAYSYDCRKFITGCDASCPTPTEAPALAPEKITASWEERRAIYARHHSDLVLVTPSRWLADEARAGLFAQHRVEVIPYGLHVGSHGIPTGWHSLSLAARTDARSELGINPGGPVLLIAAFDLNERRKGAEILPRLWQHIQHRPLTVLTMGKGEVRIDDPLIEVHPLGWIDGNAKKSLAYSAADALLHPAPVDNFPNVVLEALACGTPTIALPVGGVPEMVRPGVSGWLADAATAEALGQAVERAVRDLALGKNLRESCRALAEKEYSLELQGQRYFQLFQQLRRR